MSKRQVAGLPVQEREVASGSWDNKRTSIDRIILHTTVGSAESAANWFNNPSRAELTSAHYIVTLEGKYIHLVDEDNVAYHAGNYAMNQRSIGIEHEDNNQPDQPRSDALYAASARLVRDIAQFYGIPLNRGHILKHSEASNTPCPHSLDVDRIIREARAIPAVEVEAEVRKIKVTAEIGVRTRTNPVINSQNIMGVLPKGTELEIISEVIGDLVNSSNKWYQVKLDSSRIAYVWAGAVEVTEAVKADKPKDEPKPEQTNWEQVAKEAIKQRDEAYEFITHINDLTRDFLQTPDPRAENQEDKKSWWNSLLSTLRIKK